MNNTTGRYQPVLAPKKLKNLARKGYMMVGTFPLLNKKGRTYTGYYAVEGKKPRVNEIMHRINPSQMGDLISVGAVDIGSFKSIEQQYLQRTR